jgi:hypothetical protein
MDSNCVRIVRQAGGLPLSQRRYTRRHDWHVDGGLAGFVKYSCDSLGQHVDGPRLGDSNG